MQPLPLGIDIITIYGPTASGKTSIAVQLAEMLGAVLFSGDSRQVYRGMDIGTGKDLSEYQVGGYSVPYRMIDVAEAGEQYNLHRYMGDFYKAFDALPQETPKILCGGTGLYMTAVLGGYKMPKAPIDHKLRAELDALSVEELQARLLAAGGSLEGIDCHNSRRLVRAIELALAGEVEVEERAPLRGPIFCVDVSREVRRERISRRLLARLEKGMIDEVRGLLEQVEPDALIRYGLEYKFVTLYLLDKLSYEEMHRGLETAIHQFAKRQMTWARGMERNGFEIEYISPLATPRETAEAMKELIFNKYQ
ncbi:tRNA (adenosine(37)-N6)-dimethylallyltransferase [Porphyromonas levii]|uniref:tRNA (adenosine(37)-N6)-dimethylallyltransferase n=1 Tax=Porphyromonas levii TaxID=28114 RepID=UPI001B8BA2E1|nr:tRNA (adenosine(37)-N6)-dimethylallyltransferase MiaA [Porphyromonas levii]MBR8714073.1 tRNA dimethylallyltransferase [Porphyromonas levii]MBR8715905.1 tRNA dimethylallyltransferase [Porphyromonas levii]MBR8728608.1 tRNA dimethylallyltransferase [Porphyromonas levii]MBR8736930.1 tRNA dimethylallyltransferase [Porphyromonas levii]MBR8774058.1 tRNA dimethylallyltransferase [Porphyromonas levii]